MLQAHAAERIEFLKNKTIPQRLLGPSKANDRKNFKKQCNQMYKLKEEVKGTAMIQFLIRKHKSKSKNNPSQLPGEAIWKIQIIQEKMEEFVAAQHIFYSHLGASNLLTKLRESHSFHPGNHPDVETKPKNWIEKEVHRICDACITCQLPKESKVWFILI
jgi:hypothetical protein